jgi:hypothetical protein
MKMVVHKSVSQSNTEFDVNTTQKEDSSTTKNKFNAEPNTLPFKIVYPY